MERKRKETILFVFFEIGGKEEKRKGKKVNFHVLELEKKKNCYFYDGYVCNFINIF